MNERQKHVLIYAGAAITAMLLFPPYVVRGGNTMVTIIIESGYAFLFNLPYRATIDIGTLLMQWLATAVVGTIAFALAKDAPQLQHRSMREALRRLGNDAPPNRSAVSPNRDRPVEGVTDWMNVLKGVIVVVAMFALLASAAGVWK